MTCVEVRRVLRGASLGMGFIGCLSATILEAQTLDLPAAPRIVDLRTEPDTPSVGQPFEVQVVLRIPPGLTVFLPDTLMSTETAQSAGSGSWTATEAAGDSLEVRAAYPVIGFRPGDVVLPAIELRTAAAAGRAVALPASDAERRAALQSSSVESVALGGVFMTAITATSADSALVPRPAADVAGGEWSPWLIFALGAATLAGVGGAGAWFTGSWSRLMKPFFGKRRHSAKQAALQELDRIRGTGWHLNGRVDDFYAASTDALRRYAGEIDAEWASALTSTELMGRLEAKWGAGRVAALTPVVQTSERVKFGKHRPAGETAEADWSVIRDWIRGGPDI